jgi:hypothetical protein
MAPVVLAALISPAMRPQLRWTRAIVTAVPALALSGLWFWHNVAVYGDLAGTRPFSAFGAVPGEGIGGWRLLLAGRPTLPRAHRFWPEVFRTSVGVLRWSDLHLPPALYLIALVAGLAGLVSVGMWWRRSEAAGGTSSGDDRVLLVVGATLAAQVLGLVWFAMTVDYQPQGRYLLVGILASAAAVGAAVGPRRMAAAGLCLTALLASAVVTAATTFGLP